MTGRNAVVMIRATIRAHQGIPDLAPYKVPSAIAKQMTNIDPNQYQGTSG